MLSVIEWVVKVAGVIFTLTIAILLWKTGEYFNTLPEDEKYKPVIAWDLMIMFFTLVALVWRLITM